MTFTLADAGRLLGCLPTPAGQANGTDPTAALAMPPGLSLATEFSPKRMSARRADDLCRLLQDL